MFGQFGTAKKLALGAAGIVIVWFAFAGNTKASGITCTSPDVEDVLKTVLTRNLSQRVNERLQVDISFEGTTTTGTLRGNPGVRCSTSATMLIVAMGQTIRAGVTYEAQATDSGNDIQVRVTNKPF